MSSPSNAEAPADALTPPATVGIVGLGRMGAPMAARLAAAGWTVRAFDVVEAARARFEHAAGIAAVGDPAATTAGADAVITMLPDSRIVRAAVIDGGLLDAMSPGTVLIDMSSSEPTATRELAQLTAEHGVELIDAPVSGGVVGAEAGSLTIMVGGSDTAVARVRPVLGDLGTAISHVGTVGAGHALKALNNLLSATSMLITAEAVRTGRTFGLDPAVMVDAINTSSGRSWSTQHKFPNYVLPESWTSGFGVDLMLKDAKIALDLARATDSPCQLAEHVVELWTRAQGDIGDADHTEIARWVDELQ